MKPTILSKRQLITIGDRHAQGETLSDLATEFHKRRSHLAGLLRANGLLSPEKRWPPTVRNFVDPIKIGYVAGLIDGEGNISRIMGKKSGERNYMVRIRMTDEPVIAWLHTNIGGARNHKPYQRKIANRKPSWEWWVARRADVITVLQVTLPHLIVKKTQAEKVLRILLND